MKRIGKWLALTAAIGLVGGILVLAVLWCEHNRRLELPVPTGSFPVGRISALWTDGNRTDPLAASSDQKRELIIWIWYPARLNAKSAAAPYLPKPWASALAAHAGVLLTQFLNRNPACIDAHSYDDAELAPEQPTYPVVILRSGIGAMALDYTTIAEDLASHGYIVVGADAPYSTSVVVMPDGRVIHKTTSGNPNDAPVPETERERLFTLLLRVWTEDTKFLVDRLEWLNAADPSARFIRRLDLASIGVAGHSFGGATAAQFCHDDARCKAGIDMDGRLFGSVVHEGFKQPFLFLLSDHGDAWNSPDCRIAADIRSAAARIPGDRLIVTLQGAHHFSFSDQALVKSQIALRILRAAGVVGDLDGRDGLDCTRRYVREFFDVHLRGAPREALYQAPLTPVARFETK